jgi:hypothetical protein
MLCRCRSNDEEVGVARESPKPRRTNMFAAEFNPDAWECFGKRYPSLLPRALGQRV